MTDKLYHECHEIISQGRLILEELQQWGVNVAVTDGEQGVAVPKVFTSLKELEESLSGCNLCSLSQTRNKIVFGYGNPNADLVLVGEAPGREEDVQGFPFVGEAGRLLDRILFSMGLNRDDTYICNVIKCRPPNNRDPQTDEICTCEPFLKHQLAIIKPRLILALGRFSAQTLLKNKEPISRMRGCWYEYEGVPLMPTYHPAYLLRNPAGKKEVWEDVKQVLSRLKPSDPQA